MPMVRLGSGLTASSLVVIPWVVRDAHMGYMLSILFFASTYHVQDRVSQQNL